VKHRLRLIIWGLSLWVCPLTQSVIGARYDRYHDRSIVTPGWVPLVVHGLFGALLVISLVAAVSVVWVMRGWWRRLLAWALVAALLPLAFYNWWSVLMQISGSVL
jgi:hypothetical protein